MKEYNLSNYEKKHIEILRNIVPECMVLLKKDGSFPLKKPAEIALYGSGAIKTLKGGTGSGDVNVRHFTTIEEGLENAGFSVTTKRWMDTYEGIYADAHKEFVQGIKDKAKQLGISALALGMGAVMPEPEYELPLQKDGEAAIYVLARISGEGSDRKAVKGDLLLTDTEIRDIQYLNQHFKKFMLVLNVGGVVDISPVQSVKNILLLSQPGMTAGDSLADVLLGKTYPSGCLTDTWAAWEDYGNPDFGHPDDTTYEEGIYVGYRYFDTNQIAPIYPFGYGLGYTDFSYSVVDVCVEGTTASIKVQIKNVGIYPGKETIQMYVSFPQGKLEQPKQILVDFAKTKELLPDDCDMVELQVTLEDFSSYDIEIASKILEKGICLSKQYGVDEEGIYEIVSGVPSAFAEFIDEEMLKKFGLSEKSTKREGTIRDQYCSAIPIGTALAQSMNLELMEACGDIVGAEMERFGVHLWLAPALNIHRTPLCGRNFEYYSEDPYISGKAAAAVTRGVQRHKGCGVTIKHFCCNNQETNRFYSNSILDERTLREIYLKGFEIVIKEANPMAVMTSYNLLNGEHTAHRRDLNVTLLRKEWNYKGLVMSDWVIAGLARKAKYDYESAAGCVKGGNDLMMPGGAEDVKNLLEALHSPEHKYYITRQDLLDCASSVIRTIELLKGALVNSGF